MNKQPDKRKRVDRADKLKLRKTHQETVVKSTLLNYVICDPELKLKFTDAIKKRVLVYSQRVNMASLALTDIIKKSYDKVDDVFDVELPDIFDQTFFRQLMLGTENTSIDNQLKDYFKENPNYLIKSERHLMDRNIYSAGATKYITNLKNSLIFNLEKRIRKYTKIYQEKNKLKDEVKVAILYKINGWKMPNEISKTELTKEIIDECEYHRYILGLDEDDIIDPENNIELQNILNYYVYLNKYYESIDKPMFNLVPICNIKLHYITIDKSVFYGILKEIKLIDCNEKVFNSMSDDHFKSILNIKKLQGSNNQFTGTIETDGIILCTHFLRPKRQRDDNKIEILETDRVIAIDPGRVNIYYGVENKSNKIYKLTRRQYYKESGTDKANQKSISWQKKIKKQLIELSKVSTKGSSVKKHREYFDVYISNYDSLWNEYTKSRWSRQRFRLYGAKKRVFAKFFNTITNEDPTRRVIIAFGNAKFPSGGKNEQSIPTTQAFKECASRFLCKNIDEFRTTRICHEDDSVLKKVAFKDAIEPKNWIRGLLWCSSTNNSKFINRDFNGAMNILRCALQNVRPLALQRQPNQERLKDILGKKIKRCCNT